MGPSLPSDDLRAYLIGCVLAARPSRSRVDALNALGHPVGDAVESPSPVDWEELEREARRQGCTVADIVFDISGRASGDR